jgi:pSer/pThr/pTyr-binding forkhead associated (FHA) protein
MQGNCVIIEVIGGKSDGETFEFDRLPITLGRHPEDDVYLPFDNRTSRHHARILVDGSTFFIEDVGPEGKGSTNGTYLNDKQIFDKTALSPGDIILLGNNSLRFRVNI